MSVLTLNGGFGSIASNCSHSSHHEVLKDLVGCFTCFALVRCKAGNIAGGIVVGLEGTIK